MFNNLTNKKDGFTLVELLLVIAIIGILFAIVFVAIDPSQRLQESRDAVRQADVRDILEATQQYVIDNEGSSPFSDDGTAGEYELLCEGDNATDGADCSDPAGGSVVAGDCSGSLPYGGTFATGSVLSLDNLVGTYLTEYVRDPKAGAFTSDTQYDTGYAVDVTDAGSYVIASCDYEASSDAI